MRYVLPAAVVAATLVLLGGCAQRPAARLGSLPFPGPFTLYAVADPADLGEHRYGAGWLGEKTPRGILYTERAGFVDLSHLRDSIDWTRYFTEQFEDALAAGEREVKLRASEPSVYHVTLNYPDWWDDVPASERAHVRRETAIALGARMAWLSMSWHEMLTWFGYKSMGILPEDRSAFTWDDTAAHAIGIEVARAALLQGGEDFDAAVTRLLDERLAELGARDPDGTDAAVEEVRDRWWRHGEPLWRQMELGLTTDIVRPALVPGSRYEPAALEVPHLGQVAGRDVAGMMAVRITPKVFEAGAIRSAIAEEAGVEVQDVRPLEHWPALRAAIARVVDARRPTP